MVLFDVGGTKTRVTASFDGRTMAEPKIAPTPENFADGVKTLKRLADEATGGGPVKGVFGGVPGILSRDQASIFKLPNLPGWDDRPLKSELEKIFNAPVDLENDAALAGLGEAVFGAGRGHDIVAYYTVSTGVGGARIVGGKIDQRLYGFEPGHQLVNGGDLESHISGSSLERRFGKAPADITDESVHGELSMWLSHGLYNSVMLWSPDIIILGGSLVLGARPIPLEKVKAEFQKLPKIFPEWPEMRKAALGEKSGLYGALSLAKGKAL